MVKISVIIPIYNVEDYLPETLQCLIHQTVFEDIEVLMIDDGSTDNSKYIIEKYALDYDNFHAYHKEKGGPGSTRNYGLQFAKGEYIHFLDSDDYLPEDAYEKFLDMASRNDYSNDVIVGKMLRFRRYNTRRSLLHIYSFKDITEDIPDTTLSEHANLIWDTSTSNKLYKREFLEKNNLRYIEDKILYEDLLFSLEVFIHAKSIAIINDVIYYWRIRAQKSSISQQLNSLKNFKDRLTILNLSLKLMDENSIDEEIYNRQYDKWLRNDFIIYLKEINEFPPEEVHGLLEQVNNILELIPSQIRNSIPSYLKVVYKMVENYDIDSLVKFAPLEHDLKFDPYVPDYLDAEYVKLIDYNKDYVEEEFKADVFEVTNDEENIYFEFENHIYYWPHENFKQLNAYLMHDGNEYPLEITGDKVVLPVNLVKDKNHSNIKLVYNDFYNEKETILINNKRYSFNYDEFDVDISIGYNRRLYIDIQEKSGNKIDIDEISFENDEFIIGATSKSRVSKVFIQNVISFKRVYYPVEYLENGKFTFTIPYADLLNDVVKKWELNCEESLNSIEVAKKFKFFRLNSNINFNNTRNKVLITEDIFDPIEGLMELDEKHDDLRLRFKEVKRERKDANRENRALHRENRALHRENKKLKNEVDYLNNRVEEFKNRKVVKLADKLKL